MSRSGADTLARRLTIIVPVVLADDEVLVCVVALPLERALTLPDARLDAEENQRAARFVFAVDRARHVTSHLVLRHVLGAALGGAPVNFAVVAPGQKPRLREGGLHFNLSQAGAMAVVALGRREVGVDVEVQAAIDRTPIEGQLAPGERAALAALSEPERRAAMRRLWVRKEAYLKARGTGLGEPLDGFDMSVALAPRLLATRPDAGEAARWNVVTIPVPAGYEAALVHAAPAARVTVRELPWSDIEP
jgi:4'-phosphopantetheinyl transferase